MSRHGMRILVVEDFASLRSLVVRVLASEGCETVGVGTAAEAIALADREQFDLLIADNAVPGGYGVEIAREAVRVNPDMKVLFMSGSPETTLDLEVPGVRTRFLQKPFDLDVLIALVHELLTPAQ